MDADWASLPCDLLVDIFRRLGSTSVVRCAGACRPWRRAIIGNASCLRLRGFLPGLLVAFFHGPRSVNLAPLQYVPGPLEDTLDLEAGLKTAAGIHIRIAYNVPLSSRDGFLLLLLGGRNYNRCDICLCNPLTGSCRFLPVAAIHSCTYVLVTGYDYDDEDLASGGGGHGDGSAVRILAMEFVQDEYARPRESFMYQVFSSTSGRWGPVKRTAKLNEPMGHTGQSDVVVCRGSIHWLVRVSTATEGHHRRVRRTCTFAMDLRTERTWTTELPEKHAAAPVHCPYTLVLATSEDGRLSLVALPQGHRVIEVWVLAVVGDQGSWTLRRTIELPDYPSLGLKIKLGGFCPRSGCLFGMVDGQDLHFAVCVDGHDGGSLRHVQTSNLFFGCPYEMDWSTYLSKMKYF